MNPTSRPPREDLMDWQTLSFEMAKYGLTMLGVCLACPGEPHNTALGLIAHRMQKDPTFLTASLVYHLILNPRTWIPINLLERSERFRLQSVLITTYLRGGVK